VEERIVKAGRALGTTVLASLTLCATLRALPFVVDHVVSWVAAGAYTTLVEIAGLAAAVAGLAGTVHQSEPFCAGGADAWVLL
jgi:hypothetical protein